MSISGPVVRDVATLDSAVTERFDHAISELSDGAVAWSKMTLAERAELIGSVHQAMSHTAARWARTASDIKGLPSASPLVGEEWISGPYAAVAGAGTLAHSLRMLAAGRRPLDAVTFTQAPGGRVGVPVLPGSAKEAILLHGFRATVWMPPGMTAREVRESAGLGALRLKETGGVGLVLGAGNITSIAPLDVLYELVAHNRSVILKLNPTLERMMSVYLSALGPLIRADLVRIVQGGAAEGDYLARHPGVAHVHITGSSATHDAIVWGTGAAGQRNRTSGERRLTKPITSELGGVSPVIVVPGAWSKKDLRYQAEHVATMRLHNSGHNCIAAQMLVLSRDWPQKEEFLTHLRDVLRDLPARSAWYPGSQDRLAAAAAEYPGAEHVVSDGRMLVRVPPTGSTALESTEYFAPVLGVVELDGGGQEFLDAAVNYANEDLHGTLGANVIIAPKDRRALGEGLDRAIADLRYGTVAINAWTGLGFLTPTAPWGAFPGHTVEDVQSGIGVVHNALLIDNPERTVVTGPFRPFPRSLLRGEFSLFPKPPWFVTARTAAVTGRRLTGYVARPSWFRLPGIFAAAFRA